MRKSSLESRIFSFEPFPKLEEYEIIEVVYIQVALKINVMLPPKRKPGEGLKIKINLDI